MRSERRIQCHKRKDEQSIYCSVEFGSKFFNIYKLKLPIQRICSRNHMNGWRQIIYLISKMIKLCFSNRSKRLDCLLAKLESTKFDDFIFFVFSVSLAVYGRKTLQFHFETNRRCSICRPFSTPSKCKHQLTIKPQEPRRSNKKKEESDEMRK